MTELVTILKNQIKVKKPVSIYCDSADDSHFVVGYIANLSEEFVIINELDSFGKDDGKSVLRIKDVFRLDKDGKYERTMDLLHKLQKQTNIPSIDEKVNVALDDLFCNYALSNHLVISILFADEGKTTRSGLIKFITSNLIGLSCINEYGEEDGDCLIDRTLIERMSVLSQYEKMISLLHEVRKTKTEVNT